VPHLVSEKGSVIGIDAVSDGTAVLPRQSLREHLGLELTEVARVEVLPAQVMRLDTVVVYQDYRNIVVTDQ
jgi:hypothetical protein